MRIIAGKYGGRSLIAPDSAGTRPVTEMVRNAICNALAASEVLEDAAVLDLFAGSGGLGLEALSRDAARAVFVDAASAAVVAIRHNVQTLGLDAQTQILKQTVESYLDGIAAAGTEGGFDIVFFDPPYDEFSLDLAARAAQLVSADGVLVISASKKSAIPAIISPLSQAQAKVYGDTQIAYFVR